MHYFQNTYPSSIVGIKRQLFPTQMSTQLEDTHKKVKPNEEPIIIKLEDSKPIKEPLSPQIPPLLLNNKPNNNNTNANLESLQPLLLLNRVSMIQQYMQLLTLKNYMEQQRNLLCAKRDTSALSCNSNSTSDTLSPMKSPIKAPIMIPIIKPKDETPPIMKIPKLISSSPNKNASKVSACKNYIALLCTGFARSILTATAENEIMIHLHKTIHQKKAKYLSLAQRTQDELIQFMIEHIHRDICGKRVKKMNKGRDFKVRNTDELIELIFPKEGDSELLKLRKEVLKEMLDYFFTSKCYFEWLEKGMINEANKNFFLKNKVEIRKKFSNPSLYKPHFDYN